MLYLLEGMQSAGPLRDGTHHGFDFWIVPPGAVLSVDGAVGQVETPPAIRPEPKIDDVAGELAFIPEADQVNRFFWVPSIDAIVLGRASKIAACLQPDELCPGAAGRLFLVGGMVSACHLAHVHEKYTTDKPCNHLGEIPPPETLFTYRTRNHGRRATANAFLHERTVADGPLVLRWRVGIQNYTLTLRPNAARKNHPCVQQRGEDWNGFNCAARTPFSLR